MMIAGEMLDLQKTIFSLFNQFAEPLIRAGVGNPILWPTGTIVVETTGRKTGRKINIPVLAARFGDLVVFSTVRRNSQWLKNLIANPEVCYWLAGQKREAIASIIADDENTSLDNLPSQAECLAVFLRQQSSLFGINFAILTPRP